MMFICGYFSVALKNVEVTSDARCDRFYVEGSWACVQYSGSTEYNEICKISSFWCIQ